MKNFTPLVCVAALLLFLNTPVIAQQAFAKNSKASLPVNHATHLSVNLNETAARVIAHPEAKMVNKLMNLYPGAINQEWRLYNKHYHVSFFTEGRKANAVLTPKGIVNYILVECQPNQLPLVLQKKMERFYTEYAFVRAVQIHAYDRIAHQVILESANDYVTLQATADGVEEVQRLKKTKLESK